MKFEFRPILTMCALAGLAVLVMLGNWQLQRLEWKRDLIATSEARVSDIAISLNDLVASLARGQDREYQPVSATGVYHHDGEQRVFGTLGGEPGYYLFTPMMIGGDDTNYIYVNRGFVPQTVWQSSILDIERPTGEVDVRGLYRGPEIRRGLTKALAPENQLEENLWFQRRPDLMADRSQITAHIGYLDLIGDSIVDQWPKSGTTRLDFSNRHMEYALTWFGLAGTLIGVWGAFSIKRD